MTVPRRADLTVFFAAALIGAAAAPGLCADYRGSLDRPGVVWVSDESKPAPLPESEMRNESKSFIPDLLVITAGSSVRFPNADPFFHSIYSPSKADPFDIGFYDTGPGKVVDFAQPGVVDVRCHIHGSMHATIIVVDGPWAKTDAPGAAYVLSNVRPGVHILHVWSREGGEQTSRITVKDRS